MLSFWDQFVQYLIFRDCLEKPQEIMSACKSFFFPLCQASSFPNTKLSRGNGPARKFCHAVNWPKSLHF